ncbi:DUF2303 family protein [Roseovarius pacificus]|uniref:DUF2303 family protein n=1 Tax=Roseovarius pacificus TaxID=337701 RepID=UPI002A18A5A7|nr:DUF2303 family protein [Roseovarius pacificus]
MSHETEALPCNMQALADMARKFAETEELTGLEPAHGEAVLLSVPEGRRIEDMTTAFHKAQERYRPARRKGTARLATLVSLIDWANRFKGDTSVLYADPTEESISLTCIANYHAEEPAANAANSGEAGASHCDHRGVYRFPLSKEWKRWTALSGKWLEKDEFCSFIEDNAKDLVDPSPALLAQGAEDVVEPWERRNVEIRDKINGRFGQLHNLIAMGRQFQVHETSDLDIKTDPDTGETRVSFNEEHRDAAGRPLKIANLYLIAIPVFESGDLFRLTVRFAYRKIGGNLRFSLNIYNPHEALDIAFNEAVDKAVTETDLPVFQGSPESA